MTITKTSLLAATIAPQIRDYIDSAMKDLAEAHSKELASLKETNEANQNALLTEISVVRANLNTVNGLIVSDPSHRITKLKLITIATELGL
jgi:UDP-glucose 4-epimerase|tara:strand:+ start:188 stop:460 length:273 start_codon:yes stop_codon:yes gene_type:complete